MSTHDEQPDPQPDELPKLSPTPEISTLLAQLEELDRLAADTEAIERRQDEILERLIDLASHYREWSRLLTDCDTHSVPRVAELIRVRYEHMGRVLPLFEEAAAAVREAEDDAEDDG